MTEDKEEIDKLKEENKELKTKLFQLQRRHEQEREKYLENIQHITHAYQSTLDAKNARIRELSERFFDYVNDADDGDDEEEEESSDDDKEEDKIETNKKV